VLHDYLTAADEMLSQARADGRRRRRTEAGLKCLLDAGSGWSRLSESNR
jgi:hypothetical protein